MKNLSLSDAELDVMQVLWAGEEALSRPQILAKMPDITWNATSINQVLNNLMKKEVLRVDGITQCGRIYGRTYAPCITREEFIEYEVKRCLPHLSSGKRIVGIVAAMTFFKKVDKETIEGLEQMLAKWKQEQHL